jgi:hypothetical protein
MKRFTMAIAGLGLLSFTGMAQALPLCGTGFGKGDLAKAADDAQRAYDLISGDANTAPECLVGRP